MLVITLTLAGLGMIGPFATDTYLPSFQEIEAEYGVSEVLVQQTLSVYLVMFAVMTLVYGTLSDIFGRKPVILIGLSIFLSASVFAAFAPNFECLLIARALQGISAGAGVVVGQAIVRDLYKGSTAQQLMANIAMVFALAPALAPVIGGFIADYYGWRFVFVFIAAYALVMLFCTTRYLPESLPPSERQPIDLRNLIVQYKASLKDIGFVCAALGTGLSFAGQGIYIACASNIIVKILGMNATDFAWLFIPMITGTAFGSWVSGRLANYFSTIRIVNIGLSLLVVGAVMDFLFAIYLPRLPVPWIFAPLTVFVTGASIARPGMVILSLDMRRKTLGLASSLISFAQTVVFATTAGVIAPLVFGSLEKISFCTLTFSILSVVFWTLGGFLRRHLKSETV